MIRLAILLSLLLPATASAKFVFFQTPSHNIGCVYSSSPASLRCDIRSGLRPPPAKPKGCQNDWTFGYRLGRRGPSRTVCAGDTVLKGNARVLGYEKTWTGGPFGCTSLRLGLYCSNKDSYGFFLSRGHSYRFNANLRATRIRTPTGNIGCEYQYLPPISMRCDVNGGIKPLPPKPRSCEFDWGAGFGLRTRGKASVVCTSGAINFPPQRTLRYGAAWRPPGFTCRSRRKGLTCRNRSGHGFFLSRARSYRF